MRAALNEAIEEIMEDVRSSLHHLSVLWGGVHALTVLDGALEHVGEFLLRAQVRRADEIDHAPILHQIILQRVARQNNTTSTN